MRSCHNTGFVPARHSAVSLCSLAPPGTGFLRLCLVRGTESLAPAPQPAVSILLQRPWAHLGL